MPASRLASVCLAFALAAGSWFGFAVTHDAPAATLQAYPVPPGGPHAVAALRSGSEILVGARDCGYAGQLALASGAFATFVGTPTLPCTPDAGMNGRAVFSMVEGLDGKVYFTLYDSGVSDGIGSIARVNRDGTSFESMNVGAHPLDVTVGPDGNVWFTVNGSGGVGGAVGRVNAGSPLSAQIVGVPGNVQGPRGIVSGPDGNLYVLGADNADKIWKVTTAATPVVTEVANVSNPSFGELGPDGRIWFTRFEDNSVAAFTPGSNVVSTPSPVPGNPWDIAFGGDGKGYITLHGTNAVVQLTRGAGAPSVSPLTVPAGTIAPTFAVRGLGGEVYAAARGSNTVLEILTDQLPVVATGAPAGVTQTAATIPVTVDPKRFATQVRVAFGPSTAYGVQSASVDAGSARGPTTVNVPLSGLTPATTYHARAVATNAHGSSTGANVTFTTPAAVAPPPPPAVKPALVGGRVVATWSVRRKRTRVVSLSARSLPQGVRVEVRCSGSGCPFTRKRITPKRGVTAVSLTSLFKRRTLRAGRTIEVRITRAPNIGRVVRFVTRATASPKRTNLCLAVGATRPTRC